MESCWGFTASWLLQCRQAITMRFVDKSVPPRTQPLHVDKPFLQYRHYNHPPHNVLNSLPQYSETQFNTKMFENAPVFNPTSALLVWAYDKCWGDGRLPAGSFNIFQRIIFLWIFLIIIIVFLFWLLQKSDKDQTFYWSSQTCSRIRRLFGRCHHPQKPENCPISDFFNLTSKYFLLLLPYTDLVPLSTDPVPPSTNQYRPIMTQYHHVSTIADLCWSSTTKY